ncbi:hypothetical protein STAS_17236 [Striga asiatica]|uniref:Uncharacterized protein n=1 Tax=Striga asiatica TaxID=4170 RepID=A0A5A7Q5L2_STRAF|nr:hypothetical protein STAS_17236 [Striga asiatica]
MKIYKENVMKDDCKDKISRIQGKPKAGEALISFGILPGRELCTSGGVGGWGNGQCGQVAGMGGWGHGHRPACIGGWNSTTGVRARHGCTRDDIEEHAALVVNIVAKRGPPS